MKKRTPQLQRSISPLDERSVIQADFYLYWIRAGKKMVIVLVLLRSYIHPMWKRKQGHIYGRKSILADCAYSLKSMPTFVGVGRHIKIK